MACPAGGAARPAFAALARALLVALSVGAAAPAGAAAAQERAEPPPEALEFYLSGRAHFSAGRYREAIDDLERARMLDPESPTLVYNLARVHELLGQLDRALVFYQEYLRILPEQDAEARERTAETIDRLQGARGQAPSGAGPTGPPEDDEVMDAPVWVERWGVADVAFWVTAGSAAVLLIAGTAFGVSALSAESDAESIVVSNEDDALAYEAAALNADDRAFVADLLIVGGLASAVVAGLLYALRSETVETHPSYGDTQAFVTTDGERTLVGLRGAL